MWVVIAACCVAFTAIDTAPAEVTPPASSWGRHAQQSSGMAPLWEDTGAVGSQPPRPPAAGTG